MLLLLLLVLLLLLPLRLNLKQLKRASIPSILTPFWITTRAPHTPALPLHTSGSTVVTPSHISRRQRRRLRIFPASIIATATATALTSVTSTPKALTFTPQLPLHFLHNFELLLPGESATSAPRSIATATTTTTAAACHATPASAPGYPDRGDSNARVRCNTAVVNAMASVTAASVPSCSPAPADPLTLLLLFLLLLLLLLLWLVVAVAVVVVIIPGKRTTITRASCC